MPSDETQPISAELTNIQDAYNESFYFLQSWKRRKVSQLVLLNNLQRGDQNIASTLLVTLFLRSVSNSYNDKIQVKFLPSQGIEQEQLNSYNILAQSDYLEMEKAKLDYEWVWDSLFFGRGYCETYKFNKKRKIMEPVIINPLVFGYDPYFENVQDWRYYWKWITKSKYEIQRLIKNSTITGITKPEEIPSGVDEYLWNYKSLRDKAKKGVEPSAESESSSVYQILEFYGYDEEGNKVCRWVDKSFTKVLYTEKLEFDDLDYGDQDDKGSKWPIVLKEAFKEPHSSISFGVPDLLEDKHRAKSVLLNLAFIAAKDRANPIYLYNTNKVTDSTQLFSRQINQHIPVSDVDGAVVPLNTEDPMSAGLIQFISMITGEANDPIGTGQVGQPMAAKGDKTATHDAIQQQLNDMATSLQSKVMQFGESEFWSHWFHRYAKYGKELKDKMANIVGVKGISTEIVDFKDFNTNYPPGVLIYSAKEAEYKNLIKRRDWMQIYPQIAQTTDPDGFRNWNKHIFMPLMVEDPSMIELVYPKTLDEIKAEDENEQLIGDTMPDIAPTDNHITHIFVHSMIPPGKRTWSMWFHKAAHEQMLAEQKAQQMQAEQMAIQQQQMKMGGGQELNQSSKINVGKEKRSPMAAVSPIKTEMNPNNSIK